MSAAIRPRRWSGRRGATLLEVVIASSILAIFSALAASAVQTSGRVSARTIAEQEATRAASEVLHAVVQRLQHADPSTLVFSPFDRGLLSFQETITYDPQDLGRGRVVSGVVTLQATPLAGTARFGLLWTQAGGMQRDGDEFVVCHKPGGDNAETRVVPAEELADHLDHGDTLGACDWDPDPPGVGTPLARRVGGGIAAVDLEEADLPGLNFDVRVVGAQTHIDIRVTVEVPAGDGTLAQRLLTTTVVLQ